MTTILHNTRCSTSRAALENAERVGADVEIRHYLRDPLTADELRELLGKLEDPPGDLVRRDPGFAAAGLTEGDVDTPDKVVAVLAAHPELMQRPVLVRGDRAIIGRPKDRVAAFLGE